MRKSQLISSASLLAASVLILSGVPGCKKAPPPPLSKKGSTAPQGGGSNTHAGMSKGEITGQVVETMNAAGYTYLKLRTAGGEVWAAVRKANVAKGQRVTVVRAQAMKGFKSRTLKRTFALIYFGMLGQPGQAAGGHGVHGRKSGGAAHPKRTGGKRAKFDKPLAKAPGASGRTVAEIYAQKKTLAGKAVSVRGRVVKVSTNILGKNWLHVQDGTGKATDFDLTVTTQSLAKVGDVVLVTGTLRANVDIGAGYRYEVLVEKATLQPDK